MWNWWSNAWLGQSKSDFSRFITPDKFVHPFELFHTRKLRYLSRTHTVELRFNERPRGWSWADRYIRRFRYIEFFFFHIFYYYWGKENRSLYRGLRYIEVLYIEVPLYRSGSANIKVRKSVFEKLKSPLIRITSFDDHWFKYGIMRSHLSYMVIHLSILAVYWWLILEQTNDINFLWLRVTGLISVKCLVFWLALRDRRNTAWLVISHDTTH